MIVLEKRRSQSRRWALATPALAVLATMIAGGLLFAALGKDPFVAIRTIFWDPLFGPFTSYTRPQLLVKAGPLILIAIGLALGFRAGIWNIGAEGQYIMGAIVAVNSVIALYYYANVAREMWMKPVPDGDRSPVVVPFSIGAALALTVVATVAFGVSNLATRLGDQATFLLAL